MRVAPREVLVKILRGAVRLAAVRLISFRTATTAAAAAAEGMAFRGAPSEGPPLLPLLLRLRMVGEQARHV